MLITRRRLGFGREFLLSTTRFCVFQTPFLFLRFMLKSSDIVAGRAASLRPASHRFTRDDRVCDMSRSSLCAVFLREVRPCLLWCPLHLYTLELDHLLSPFGNFVAWRVIGFQHEFWLVLGELLVSACFTAHMHRKIHRNRHPGNTAFPTQWGSCYQKLSSRTIPGRGTKLTRRFESLMKWNMTWKNSYRNTKSFFCEVALVKDQTLHIIDEKASASHQRITNTATCRHPYQSTGLHRSACDASHSALDQGASLFFFTLEWMRISQACYSSNRPAQARPFGGQRVV